MGQINNDAGNLDRDVAQIAKDIDFRPYLDAVVRGSDRTRGIIIVIMVTTVLVIGAIRNTSAPSWLDSRIAKLQIARDCLKKAKDETKAKNAVEKEAKTTVKNRIEKTSQEQQSQSSISDACVKAIHSASLDLYRRWQFPGNAMPPDQEEDIKRKTLAQRFFFEKNPWVNVKIDENNKEKVDIKPTVYKVSKGDIEDEINWQLPNLLKRRTELTTAVSISFIGLQVDNNDVGLVSAAIFMALFFILWVNLGRESVNLNVANLMAPDYRSRSLLLMAQVLSDVEGYAKHNVTQDSTVTQPGRRINLLTKNRNAGRFSSLRSWFSLSQLPTMVVLSLPILTLGYVIFSDWDTVDISKDLLGDTGNAGMILETLGFLILIFLTALCWKRWASVDRSLYFVQMAIDYEIKKRHGQHMISDPFMIVDEDAVTKHIDQSLQVMPERHVENTDEQPNTIINSNSEEN